MKPNFLATPSPHSIMHTIFHLGAFLFSLNPITLKLLSATDAHGLNAVALPRAKQKKQIC